MGILLAFLSGLIAVVSRRLDKILVYTTTSQLGIVLVALGSKLREGAILLVTSNIILLGLLFLSAGTVKLAMKEENNIFKMGRLVKSLPMAALMTFMAGLGLAGFPFLAGYWPRQYLLSRIWSIFGAWGAIIISLLVITFWLAGLAVFRFLFVVFWSKHQPGGGVHESGSGIRTSRLVLLFGTLAGGIVAYSKYFQTINISELVNPAALLLWGILVLSSLAASVFLYSGRFRSPSVPEGATGFIYRLLRSELYRDQILPLVPLSRFKLLPGFLFGIVEKNLAGLPGRCVFFFIELSEILLKKTCGSSELYLRHAAFIFILLLTLFFLYLLVGV
jgi:NADH-quinone oxidoreductase subunit L